MKRFVIQNNLIAENDLKQMQYACKKNGIDYEDVMVIPFVKELPKFTIDENNVYYGSTTFITNVYEQLKPKGVFFDPNKFLISNYFNQWGKHMLNFDAVVCTIPMFLELSESKFKDDHNLFIRPNADDKSFDGQVMTYAQIKNWKENLIQYDNTKPLLESEVVIGEPYNLNSE